MKEIKQISKDTVERYSNRYKKHGKNVLTLGWGSDQQQVYRFEQIIHQTDLSKKSVLDIGCGFGDFFTFTQKNKISLKSYTGWDINQDLINEASKEFKKCKTAKFEVKNIFESSFKKPVADAGIMLGLLNFNLKGKIDNYTYSKIGLEKAFATVGEVLVIDFLSTNLCKEYPKEDFVFYHDPAVVLNMAFELTSNVILKHNYSPIPQKEFMLFLYK